MKLKYLIIFLLVLLFSQGFSYIGWNQTLGGQVQKIVLLGLLAFVVLNANKAPKTPMKPFALGMMVMPFVSILGANTVHGQSIAEGFRVTMFSFTYLLFFVMYIMKVEQRVILKMCLAFGVFWVAMETIQQITYPTIWFATRYDTFDREMEIRNDVYRFNMEGREFGLLLLFFCFQKYLEFNKRKYLYGFIAGLVGVYLLATRQIMVASVLCLLYGMFAMHKLKLTSFCAIAAIVLIIYLNMDALFGDYIEMTQQVDEDDIRLVSYYFYGIEYNKGEFLPFLLGNGLSGESAYGTEIANFQITGLYRADIGIVGMYSWYGVFYVVLVLAFFVYIFRERKYIDLYLRMYVVYMCLTSIMLHHFGYSTHHIMTLCFLLYLIDASMLKNKQANALKMQ